MFFAMVKVFWFAFEYMPYAAEVIRGQHFSDKNIGRIRVNELK